VKASFAALAFLVCACAAPLPALDAAMDRAMRAGACLRLVCDLPLDNCRIRPGVCK
jgi:hypothetical protein